MEFGLKNDKRQLWIDGVTHDLSQILFHFIFNHNPNLIAYKFGIYVYSTDIL